MPNTALRMEQVTAAVTVLTTTETVAVTSDILPLSPIGGEGYNVCGLVNITAGTATTAVVVRVRQNSLTGTVVGNALTHTLAAAAVANIAFDVQDFSAAATPVAQYVVTVQQTAATGNGTVNQSIIKLLNGSSLT